MILVLWGAAAAIGYFIGAINPATLIARPLGADLTQIGSGNPGATNAGRALGTRWGVLIALLDIVKGFAPAFVFGALGGEIAGEIAGLAAVIGHITSPFLKGRGGKGVATTLGAILGVQPWFAIPVLIAFGLGVARWRQIGLGATLGAVVLAICGIIAGIAGWVDPSDAVFAVALAAIVLGRHTENIRRAFSR